MNRRHALLKNDILCSMHNIDRNLPTEPIVERKIKYSLLLKHHNIAFEVNQLLPLGTETLCSKNIFQIDCIMNTV